MQIPDVPQLSAQSEMFGNMEYSENMLVTTARSQQLLARGRPALRACHEPIAWSNAVLITALAATASFWWSIWTRRVLLVSSGLMSSSLHEGYQKQLPVLPYLVMYFIILKVLVDLVEGINRGSQRDGVVKWLLFSVPRTRAYFDLLEQ